MLKVRFMLMSRIRICKSLLKAVAVVAVKVFFHGVKLVPNVLLALGAIIPDLFESFEAFSQLVNGIAKSLNNASI